MKIKVLIYIFLFCQLVFYGCSKTPEDSEVVLASIGDSEITVSDLNERISNLPPKYQEVVSKRKEEFLEEIINDTLLYREALEKDLDKDREVQKVIEEAKKKILIARLLKDEVDDRIEISEEDIQIFYEANQKRYMAPEIMRVSHILVHSQEEAVAILSEIENGASFEDMARAKSVDPTAQRGGDIGYFPKGQLMPEFEAACNGLEVGQISGIVKTSLGYHLIKLTDRKPPKLRPLEQVVDDVKARLHNIKRQEIFGALLKRLRRETPVLVNREILIENKNKTEKEDNI